jgi:hypothetical protein
VAVRGSMACEPLSDRVGKKTRSASLCNCVREEQIEKLIRTCQYSCYPSVLRIALPDSPLVSACAYTNKRWNRYACSDQQNEGMRGMKKTYGLHVQKEQRKKGLTRMRSMT